jgi:hypothetical protein
MKMFHNAFRTYFEGEEEQEQQSQQEEQKNDENATFTQEELNSILARERKKTEERTKQTIKELEELKKSKSMNEQDRAKLTARIEGLQDELLTKEQLAAKEKEKLSKQYTEEIEKLSSERSTWQQRYTQAEISRAISDAASEAGAFAARDIKALLLPNTQLNEVFSDDGEATGQFEPRVKFADSDKDGKPVTLDLSVQEAVKRMKDTPEKYGHLFKSTAQPGLGGSGGAGSRPVDISKMSPAEYREYRKKEGLNTVR